MPDKGMMTVPAASGLGLKFASGLFEKYGV
jgi:hypothetical protein